MVVIPVDADDDVPEHHEGDAEEYAGDEPYHEQLGDREPYGDAQDDEVRRWRDDGPEHGAGRDDGAGAAGIVPDLFHHGQQQPAQGRGLAHRRPHEPGKDDGCENGRIAQPAAYPAHQELGQPDHAHRKPAGRHDLTGEDEEGYGHERIVVGTVQHGLGDDQRVYAYAAVDHQDGRTEDEHLPDGHAEEQEKKERTDEDEQFHAIPPFLPPWAARLPKDQPPSAASAGPSA